MANTGESNEDARTAHRAIVNAGDCSAAGHSAGDRRRKICFSESAKQTTAAVQCRATGGTAEDGL